MLRARRTPRLPERARAITIAVVSPRMSLPIAFLPAWLRPEPAGAMVRLGRDNDGGYVAPKPVMGQVDGLLSLGLNDDWSFDRDFARLHPSAPIVGYDPTINRLKFILKAISRVVILPLAVLVKPRRSISRTVHACHVALDYGRFFGKQAVHHRLWLAETPGPGAVTLSAALADPAFAGRKRLVVKMDIEGAEYGVFASLPDPDLSNVGLLLVEFHDLSAHLAEVETLARRLARDFAVVHVHANNFGPVIDGLPQVIEVAWARRNLLSPGAHGSAGELPLPGLDQPNHARRPDIALRFRS